VALSRLASNAIREAHCKEILEGSIMGIACTFCWAGKTYFTAVLRIPPLNNPHLLFFSPQTASFNSKAFLLPKILLTLSFRTWYGIQLNRF